MLPSSPFDITKSLYAGKSIVQIKAVPAKTGVTAATTVLTLTGHGLAAGQQLVYVSGTGFTGLVASTGYYVLYIDANTFSIAATAGGTALAVGTSSAGVFQPVVVFEVPHINDDTSAPKTDQFNMPDSVGVLRPARIAVTEMPEEFSFDTGEIKRLPELFGAGVFTGAVQCTCQFFIPDPQKDASGKIALVSDAFSSIVRPRPGTFSSRSM